MAARRKKNETLSTDMEMDTPSTIVVPGEGVITREAEQLVAVDKPLNDKYMEALAFNEDMLTIMLQPSSEENAAQDVDVYVNGEAKWIRVGEQVRIKRKFVENLLRSKPISINTMHDDLEKFRSGAISSISNHIKRNPRAKYPLSILQDPSPKSGEWLRRVMYEQ